MSQALLWALRRPWEPGSYTPVEFSPVDDLVAALGQHFGEGEVSNVLHCVEALRRWAYALGSATDLLFSDLLAAIAIRRVSRSAWTLLPHFSGLSKEPWKEYLQRENSIREIWPSQRMLGEAGVYSGGSAVVQMPTSAGKSKATELVIRAAFLASRTNVAVVVAPFRALCQEIADSLKDAFSKDKVQVNQLTDALQQDFQFDFSTDVNGAVEPTLRVLVVTPEKLLYVLRQDAELIQKIGLIVYDEGHQFDTGTRGVNYELLLTSLKRLLPQNSQVVLISAVVQNAAALSSWLLNSPDKAVANSQAQTDRMVAFTSWPVPHLKAGQLQFIKRTADAQGFYVPRVITGEELKLFGRERAKRIFPTSDSGPIALYLALKVLENGAAAIYCGTKLSAAKLVRDAAEEFFPRGVSLDPPAVVSDGEEIQRMYKLYAQSFGENSYHAKAAKLGIFAHHGSTPHGIRLAVEHGMRRGLLKLVVCTSTLAQGVNLPIRYLFVTTTMQGGDELPARDLHNLMGRAGRAGMHGEGTVMFTNPGFYDERNDRKTGGNHRWREVNELLDPAHAQPTGSSLLDLARGWSEFDDVDLGLGATPTQILNQLTSGATFEEFFQSGVEVGLEPERRRDLAEQFEHKKSIMNAVESFLMAHREGLSEEEFLSTAKELATSTFAYSIATAEEQQALVAAFGLVAKRVEKMVPDIGVQARYGRSLVGIEKALRIDSWLAASVFELELVTDENELLDLLWPLLVELVPEKRLHDTQPAAAIRHVANAWLQGAPYHQLHNVMSEAEFPHGKYMRKFSVDMVVELCEQTIGYEFAFLVATIREAVQHTPVSEKQREDLKVFAERLQKRLKYGLPTQGAIAFYEVGFTERTVAQMLQELLADHEVTTAYIARATLKTKSAQVAESLKELPSFFQSVHQTVQL